VNFLKLAGDGVGDSVRGWGYHSVGSCGWADIVASLDPADGGEEAEQKRKSERE